MLDSNRGKMKKTLFLRLCWALPLVTGLAIFVIWLLTKYDFLMVLGAYCIYFGVALSVVGLVYGLFRLIKNRKNMPERQSALFSVLLLLSNLPVAIGVLVAAVAISTAYTVDVSNTTLVDLSDCAISGGGIYEQVGIVKARSIVTRTFWIKQDGGLTLSYTLNGVKYERSVSGYVTNGMGGHDIVEILQ